jgi:hypothetical protein
MISTRGGRLLTAARPAAPQRFAEVHIAILVVLKQVPTGASRREQNDNAWNADRSGSSNCF